MTQTVTAVTGQCPIDHSGRAHHGFEPFSQKNPFPAYAEMRREEPVMYDDRVGYWIVTRYADVKSVFEDWETFSSENAQAPVRQRGPEAKRIMEEGGFTAYSGLSARRPPEHTRIREVAQRAFTPRRFKALEPSIREHVVQRLEAMLTRSEAKGDFFADLAYDVPTITILSLIGADTDRVDLFKKWSDSRAAMTWGDLTEEEQIPHAHNLVDYWQECLRLVQEAHDVDRDSLVGDMVRSQAEGSDISDHEIASVVYSLLFAGHETTTTLISNAMRVLLSHPDQWEQLVADPKKIAPAIDEVLRFSGSIVAWRRLALKDTEVGGVAIPAGAELLLVMGSANRDEDRFVDGEQFDIARDNARDHLSFGFGIHYCLGNMLAKLQAKIVLEEIARHIPQVRLQPGADINFRENLSFRVPLAVPVEWEEIAS